MRNSVSQTASFRKTLVQTILLPPIIELLKKGPIFPFLSSIHRTAVIQCRLLQHYLVPSCPFRAERERIVQPTSVITIGSFSIGFCPSFSAMQIYQIFSRRTVPTPECLLQYNASAQTKYNHWRAYFWSELKH